MMECGMHGRRPYDPLSHRAPDSASEADDEPQYRRHEGKVEHSLHARPDRRLALEGHPCTARLILQALTGIFSSAALEVMKRH